jgi:glyoxylase-like metal-dependent hydrolase (beta-lactamase superfamily II)
MILASLGLAAWASTASSTEIDSLLPRSTPPYPSGLLESLDGAARRIPGPRAAEIRYLAVAESHRSVADVLEGGSPAPYVLPRTAFQVVFPDGWLMIDAGMDREVHRFYGMGSEEPYWQDRNDAVQRALREASLIVVTHEHGDHVAGVLRSPYREEIAGRTMLTKAQIETLTLAPQLAEIRLDPATADDYLVIDYELFFPIAPGVVLLKSPGHTPGHQMVYVLTATEERYLFIGDVSWALDGVAQERQRPTAQSARIREDREALGHQLAWLRSAQAAGIHIVPSHDRQAHEALERRGLLTPELVSD